jgi:hypothetical protein
MIKRVYCAAVSCLLLSQCAGTVKVMPEYKTMNVEKSRLGIIHLKESMAINNLNTIADDLGSGETKEVLHDFITSQLMESALQDGKFGDVEVINGCDTSGFSKSTQFLSSDDPVQVRIPLKTACIADSVPFLLIIDNLDISREQNPGTSVVTRGLYGTMGIRKVGAYDNLIIKGTFALWDNLAGKIVSFGKISEKEDISMGLTKQTWITMVERISSKIFVDTPYGISSVREEKQ